MNTHLGSDRVKNYLLPRTPADYSVLDHLVYSGKSNDEILQVIASQEWRSEVTESKDGHCLVCARCQQPVLAESCLECGLSVRDERASLITDLYNVALFVLALRIRDPKAILELLDKLNITRGSHLLKSEIKGIADHAAKRILSRERGLVWNR